MGKATTAILTIPSFCTTLRDQSVKQNSVTGEQIRSVGSYIQGGSPEQVRI